MPQSSAILDIAIVVILLLFLWMGARKGFFRTLADLVLVLAAVVGARILADRLSEKAAAYLTPHLQERVMSRLQASLGDLADLAEDVIAAASSEMIHTIAYGILFLAAFLVLFLLLRILVGVTDLLLRLPVLHQFNQLGGALLGLAMGCLVAWIAIRLCLAFDLWVTQEMVDGSRLLGLLDRLPHLVNL